MANKQASFAVKLLDGLSRPARAMGGALARLRKQMKQTMLVGKAGRFRDEQGKLREADGKFVKTKFGDGFKAANTGINRLAMGLAGATVKAGLLAGALANVGVGFILRGLAEATAFTERMRFAFANLTGSVSGGEDAFQRSIKLSRELGLDVQETTKQYSKLLAAQFSIGQTEELIKLTTDLKAIGATAEETQSAIRAITQIKAKGRLQAEELVGQLAEAGIATTLVYKELSKQLGVSEKKVAGLITAGAVDADMGIKAIQAAILKKVNIKKAGDAGKKFADGTLAGMTERLKNAPGQLFVRIAEASKAALPKLKGAVGQLTKMLDSIDPRSVAVAFEQMIDLARTGLTLAGEFAGGFAEGFGEIMRALNPGSIGDASKMMRELGRNVATLTVHAIELAKVVGKTFAFFASDAGRATLMVAGLSVGMFKLLGVVGAVAGAFGVTAGTGLLASMGSFGVGAAVVGKGISGLIALFVAVKAAAISFGTAAIAAITPLIVPVLAAAAAFTAAYVAMKKLLDLTGGTKWLENFGASFAGPEIPRATQRGMGEDQRNGHAYAGAGLTTTPSALVKRDQVAETSPILAAAQKQAGNVSIANLTVQLPQSAASSPRSHASAFAAALKNELAGVNAAPAGG
jgi:tape measure domain-containing protein